MIHAHINILLLNVLCYNNLLISTSVYIVHNFGILRPFCLRVYYVVIIEIVYRPWMA